MNSFQYSTLIPFQTNLNGPDQFLPHDEHYTTVRRNGAIKLRREEHGLASEEPISVPTLLEETTKVHPEVLIKYSIDISIRS